MPRTTENGGFGTALDEGHVTWRVYYKWFMYKMILCLESLALGRADELPTNLNGDLMGDVGRILIT